MWYSHKCHLKSSENKLLKALRCKSKFTPGKTKKNALQKSIKCGKTVCGKPNQNDNKTKKNE